MCTGEVEINVCILPLFAGLTASAHLSISPLLDLDKPQIIEFLDNLSVSGEDDSMNVEQVSFSKVCPDGKELAIHELDLRKKTGCSIIGYRSPNGEYIVNPEADLILQQGSKLILIGRPFQIDSLKQLYNV